MSKCQVSGFMSQVLILLVVASLLIVGCGKKAEEPTVEGSGKILSVYTVNYPLKYFAERIGGDLVNVTFPEVDGDPAFWSPDPEDISEYQKADLILLNGADYAKWTKKVTLPVSKMLNTSKGLNERFIELKDHSTHTHGPEGAHEHGGWAFTTWLDPTVAVEQAKEIKEALSNLLPSKKSQITARFAALNEDLIGLDKQIAVIVSANKNLPVVFSHPVYQYMEKRYELNGISVHWEPEEPPTEEMWNEFKDLLAKHPAKWMIWEGDPDEGTVAKLKELGLESIVFDPCGNIPDEDDFISVMKKNIEQLAEVYQKR